MIVSDETPPREGLCVYCGTSRPVTKAICPECGRTWIDTKIGEDLPPLTPDAAGDSAEDLERSAAAAAALAAAAARAAGASGTDDQEPGDETLEPEPSPDAEATSAPTEAIAAASIAAGDAEKQRPWGILIGAAIGLAAVALLFFTVLSDDGDPVATPTTTAGPTTTDAPSTTEPTTTTTSAPTTTAPTTTTTTTTTTTIPPIEPEGDPVLIEDLTLGAFALGPFGFNASTSYLGRLVASLGQPDAMVAAGVDLGLCEEDEGTAYSWDGLTAIFQIDDDIEVLVGYRLDDTGSDDPTQEITSRSGLELGDTIEDLDNIYLQSGIALQEISGKSHFLLLRSSDSATLLWGPTTSLEQSGVIEGIYSPQACDGGPRPEA